MKYFIIAYLNRVNWLKKCKNMSGEICKSHSFFQVEFHTKFRWVETNGPFGMDIVKKTLEKSRLSIHILMNKNGNNENFSITLHPLDTKLSYENRSECD